MITDDNIRELMEMLGIETFCINFRGYRMPCNTNKFTTIRAWLNEHIDNQEIQIDNQEVQIDNLETKI